MKQKVDFVLVIYQSVKWENSHRRPLYEALARELTGKAGVLCVDRPLCPFVTTLTKPVRIVRWLRNKGAPMQLADNLYLVTPWVFLHDRLALGKPSLTKINKIILRYQVEKCLKRIYNPSTQRIAWISDPLMYDWVGLFNEKLLIYECFDEYHAFPGLSEDEKKRTQFYETKVLNRANIILVSSRELENRKGKQTQNVYYLPNAVEMDHFRKAIYKETPICMDIARIKKPIIGFTGGIWGILDLKLLYYLASSRPQWSLVLIGNLSKIGPRSFFDEFKRLQKLANVYWLGWKQYSLLPNYLKAIDVCLLPYVINEWTESCHPSKLYQYLAAGKPIVSMDLPEVRPFGETVRIARSYDIFMSNIAQSLEDDDPESMIKRVEIAAQNSWDRRAQQIAEILNDYQLKNGVKTGD